MKTKSQHLASLLPRCEKDMLDGLVLRCQCSNMYCYLTTSQRPCTTSMEVSTSSKHGLGCQESLVCNYHPIHVQQFCCCYVFSGVASRSGTTNLLGKQSGLSRNMFGFELGHGDPYRVYGDGADSHRNQSFEAITLLPCLSGSSSTMDTRILVSIRNTVSTASSARTKISEVIAWSLCCLRPLHMCLWFLGVCIFIWQFLKIGLSYHCFIWVGFCMDKWIFCDI